MSKLFVPFITAGYPTMQITKEIIRECDNMNIPYIELGIPYSDPVADGPTIQRSSEIALANGTNLDGVFTMLEELSPQSLSTKLVIFSYYNPLFAYGFEKFCRKCAENGIYAVLIPDLPFEEEAEVVSLLKRYGIVLIPLVAPTSKGRLQKILQNKDEGFIYCVSSLGVTGERQNFHSDLQAFISEIRQVSSLPIAVGFGIANRQQAEEIGRFGDGVIIGSKIINIITATYEQMYGSVGSETVEKQTIDARAIAVEVGKQIAALHP